MQKLFPAIIAVTVLAVALALGWDSDTASALPLLALAAGGNFPDIDQFKRYMVTKTNQLEIIRASLYDTVLYPTAGIIALPFFQNPIGAGLSASTGNANAVKALTDTNMVLAGQLPAPQGFWIETVELITLPGSSAAANTFVNQDPTGFAAANAAAVQGGAHDVNAILSTGALVLTIGAKPYLQEANLVRFPPWCRVEYDWDVATTSGTVGEFEKDAMRAGGQPYVIDPGIAIPTGQNFGVTLQWPVIVPTPSGFNGKIQVILGGWLFRGVQ